MSHSPVRRRRRWLALALFALLPAVGAAQTGGANPGARPASSSASRRPAATTIFHDGHGLVTVVGEQASVREILRVLSRWFELPPIDLASIPDNPRFIRFEQLPAADVVRQLLSSVGRPGVRIPARPSRRAAVRPASWLMAVHDGQGAVTVSGEQASIHEVLGLVSKWFDFPIVNPQIIPEARRSMRFERVPVSQLVDGLLRSVSVNYLIMADARTGIPSKVLAAPLAASNRSAPSPAGRAGGGSPAPTAFPANHPMPEMPGGMPRPGMPGDMGPGMPVPVMPPDSMPMPMMPPDASMMAPPMLPELNPPDLSTMQPRDPQPAPPSGPAGTPATAAGASRPGLVVPGTAKPATKPPGTP